MANDFTSDPYCVALYNFESDALMTDSKGTNTLTAYNGGPAADAVNYKQGSASADFTPPTAAYILDADWASDYPLKQGKTGQKISVTCWFRIHAIVQYSAPFSKSETGFNRRCLIPLLFDTVGPAFQSVIGINDGDAYEGLYNSADPPPQTGRWYHYGFTFDNTNKAWTLDVWDDTDSSKIIDAGGVATNFMATPEQNSTLISAGSEYLSEIVDIGHMNIDELVIFSDILSSDEIDAIRQGTYLAPEARQFWPAIFGLLNQQG